MNEKETYRESSIHHEGQRKRKENFTVSPARPSVMGTIAGAVGHVLAEAEKVISETADALTAGWVNGKHATGRSSLRQTIQERCGGDRLPRSCIRIPEYAARAMPQLRRKRKEAQPTQGQIEGWGQPAHIYSSWDFFGKVDDFNADAGTRFQSM